MNENILFFYKGSHGELHTGLPILMKIFSKKDNIVIYFIYHDKQSYENIPTYYKKIIDRKFRVLFINKRTLLSLYVIHFCSKNYIITCDNGHNIYTKLLTFYWPFSRIIFYHHAYALLNGAVDSKQIKSTISFNNKYSGGHHQPLLIAHNELEIGYRKKVGFKTRNIIIAGNLGYDEKWRTTIKNSSDELVKLIKDKRDYIKVIFIPTRDIHKKYLSKMNSAYLIHSLDDIISSFPNYLFLLKPHPRQSNFNQYEAIKKKYSNCRIVSLNTITASAESDIVVSYWSSAIIDALSVGTPVVEFYRHKTYHFQLVRTDSGLISLYHYKNLCPFYTDSKDIKSLLSDSKQWDAIRIRQQNEFNKVFLKQYSSFVDDLFYRLNNTPLQIGIYIENSIKLLFVIVYKKIKAYLINI